MTIISRYMRILKVLVFNISWGLYTYLRYLKQIIGMHIIVKGYVWWQPSCVSWFYNYIWNQCLSPVTTDVVNSNLDQDEVSQALVSYIANKYIYETSACVRYTLCDKVCQWLATGRWFSPGTLVSSTNKTYHHDRTEILLKVALNTTKQTNQSVSVWKTHQRRLAQADNKHNFH